jgi:hypothetical protein
MLSFAPRPKLVQFNLRKVWVNFLPASNTLQLQSKRQIKRSEICVTEKITLL